MRPPLPLQDPELDWSLLDLPSVKASLADIASICYGPSSPVMLQALPFLQSTGIALKQITSKEAFCGLKKGELFLSFNNFFLKNTLNPSCSFARISELYAYLLGRQTVACLQRKHVPYYYFQAPMEGKIDHLDKVKEKEMIFTKGKSWSQLVKKITEADEHELFELFGSSSSSRQYFLSQDVKNVKLLKKDGLYVLSDAASATFNVTSNHRVTVGAPEKYDRSIYLFGVCIAMGSCCSDEHTIPSLLQGLLNQNGFSHVRVVNFGNGNGLPDFADIKDYINMSKTDFQPGDLAVHLGYCSWSSEISRQNFDTYFECSWLFNRRLEHKVFFDLPVHLTDYGNGLIAHYIFSEISRAL